MNTDESLIIDELYRKLHRYMYTFAMSQLKDEDLAMEAVQETFAIACNKAEYILTSENPRGWLMEALKHVILHIKREFAYMQKLYLTFEIQDKSVYITDENVDIMYSDLIHESDFQMLKKVVFERLTMMEMSEELNISVSACKKRLQRTKDRMRKALGESD